MTSKERASELRRAYEDGDCEHGDFMCAPCTDEMIARAIDAAVAEEREACAVTVERSCQCEDAREHHAAEIRARPPVTP